MSDNNGPDSTGKSPYLWPFINSRHGTVSVGEGASRPSQSKAGGSSVYEKFSSPTCHIEGDLRLRWSHEDGSGGIWSWAGTQASQPVCGNLSSKRFERFARNWSRSGLPLGRPTGGRSGHSPPLPVPPFLTKGTLVRAQADFVFLSSLLSPPGSP